MKARAPLALTPADPQPQPHPARQGHHIPAILVAQPHVSAAPRAVLPERHQDPLPLRPPPCRNPGHLAPPEVTDHCSYQRTTPAAFADLEKNARLGNTPMAPPVSTPGTNREGTPGWTTSTICRPGRTAPMSAPAYPAAAACSPA